VKLASLRGGCFRIIQVSFLLLLGLSIAGITSLTALLNHYAEGLPDVAKLRYFEPSETTRIYSADGKLIATLFKENRTWTPYDKMSPYLIKAILAVEDSRFYQHHGVDPVGVARAVVYTVLHPGGDKQGASTITMQLARNIFLSFNQTLERKIKETLLASQIEKKFTKDEILELYLNQIYFGGGAYGVQAASKTYYGKNAKDLTICEAALIAGLPQAPSEFSPLVSERAAKHRQILVLGRMYDQKFLTYKQYRAALLEARHPTFMTKKAQEFQVLEVPYFTTWVIRQLSERYDEDLLYRGGLRIHTTVDLRLQKVAEATVRNLIRRDGPGLKADCSALVCIENKTGYVRAMAGGLGWTKKNQFNRAWQAKRHPGSSFKPLVYATAVEAGYSPDSIVSDSPYTIQVSATETWSPKNSDHAFMGSINMKTALTQSRNVVAVKLLMMVGVDRVIDMAYRCGITERLYPNPSLALGAVEVSPMEMCTAYTVFPNGGLHTEITGVKAIFDSDGNPIEDNTYPKQEEVMSEITATAMTEMMVNVVENGTGTMARLSGYRVAGKTGTTDDYRDAWFCGFTSQFTTAVWVGNDDNSQMATSFGGNLPARIWQQFMQAAMTGKPSVPFGLVDKGKVGVLMCRDSKKRACMGCYRTFRNFYAPGAVPGGFCPLHGRTGDSLLPQVRGHRVPVEGPAPDAIPGPDEMVDPLDDPLAPPTTAPQPDPAEPDPLPSSEPEAIPGPGGEVLPPPDNSSPVPPPPATPSNEL
jgi:1A family penicillin-binding protein